MSSRFRQRTVLAARSIPQDPRVTGRVSKIDDFRLWDELRPGSYVPHGEVARDRDARPIGMIDAFVVTVLGDLPAGPWKTEREAREAIVAAGSRVGEENVA